MTYPSQPPNDPQGWTPQQQPLPPKKKHTARNVILGVLGGFFALIVIAAIAGGGTKQPTNTAPPATTTTDAAPASHHVVYKITGTAKHASITYTTDGMTSTSQEQGAPVPWTHEINVPTGQFGVATVNAQNSDSGTITCTIEIDGKAAKTATSSGSYAIASCSTTIEGF
jgi:hypothetical protein